ncbi:MAG: restriction endonuclease subunit S [Clostridiaceae bacterium]|nr:restriction endonuclease subunit S [Clostridiaceae bacterium]MBW4860450.1 restriction endonuclease subunit S [Clostridiaceae bacterium]MBW4868366.1 restriction endonuclease subunit S [Clostridiaceae bacterium]
MEERLVPKLRFPEFEGEWEEKKLGEIGNLKKGKGIPKSKLTDKGIKCILYGQLYTTYGEVVKEVNSYTNIDKKNLFFGQKGDILIPSSGETALDMSMVSALFKDNVALGGDINVLSPKVNVVSSKFLSYQINSVRKIDIAKIAEGASVVHLYNDNLIKVKVYIPSLQEQQKIGGFFYKIDKKLELQQEKIENLKKYKKGMMQRIFSQEIRFKDDNGNNYPDWEEKKLEEISKESIIKYKDYNKFDELLSVTLHDGIKKQSELGERDISSENKSNYKVVRKNNLVYNSMRMWQGASGISKYNGIVSSAYVVINMLGNINPEFIGYYFKQSEVIHKFYKKSQGMTSDTLTLKYNLFKDVIISIPIKEEQTKIANFLSSIDKKIELEEEKLEEYKKFKKGLMQRMFI